MPIENQELEQFLLASSEALERIADRSKTYSKESILSELGTFISLLQSYHDKVVNEMTDGTEKIAGVERSDEDEDNVYKCEECGAELTQDQTDNLSDDDWIGMVEYGICPDCLRKETHLNEPDSDILYEQLKDREMME